MADILKIKNSQGQWESIVAIKGDKGDKGDQGERGIQGTDGDLKEDEYQELKAKLDDVLARGDGTMRSHIESYIAENFGDYVVESGEYSYWTYQKWNSGKLVAYRKLTLNNFTLTAVTGGGYRAVEGYIMHPAHITEPNIVLTPVYDYYLSVNIANVDITNHTYGLRIARHFGSDNVTCEINVVEFGRWK